MSTGADLRHEADAARRIVLEAALASGSCHIGSSLSIVDILTVLYQRALRIWEQQWGPEHPNVASPLHNLADLYRLQARFAEAEPLYSRTVMSGLSLRHLAFCSQSGFATTACSFLGGQFLCIKCLTCN